MSSYSCANASLSFLPNTTSMTSTATATANATATATGSMTNATSDAMSLSNLSAIKGAVSMLTDDTANISGVSPLHKFINTTKETNPSEKYSANIKINVTTGSGTWASS